MVPDFKAETTNGPLSFYEWAGESWTYLFSHPAAFTPVCTTEMVSLAANVLNFDQRNVKLLGLCGSSLEDQRRWHGDLSRSLGAEISFPMIADTQRILSQLFGMLHWEESCEFAIRKSLLIGPDRKIRMISETPLLVGRNTDEVLRSIDAVQTVDAYNVGVPADWKKGQECLLLPGECGEPRFDHWHSARIVRSYLKFVANPWRSAPRLDRSSGTDTAPIAAAA
ncbi:Peroxidase [Rubellimicrobium mesophilum DSM 19309]|uniref:Alkyl hydroperoxide reductase C n=1 Tax=Rubellimicrobium mesophilum DSM 19309 TaxID=442562 RepID=A0A017HVF0_9RHOB|nr:Peroxidase [Rubellimicrobium mesophilum DSM 19309]